MPDPTAVLTIISGPPAVGKSTISRALLEGFSRVVYLAGDDLFDLVVGKDLSRTDDVDPDPTRTEFLLENIACIAGNALRRDMNVVFDYVALPEDISFLAARLPSNVLCRCVILTATGVELRSRDSQRPVENRMHGRCTLLQDYFERNSAGPIPYLDTTALTVAETVAALLEVPVSRLRDFLTP